MRETLRDFQILFAGLLAKSQFASSRSCDPPSRCSFSSLSYVLIRKCREGSQDSKFILRASHATLTIYEYIYQNYYFCFKVKDNQIKLSVFSELIQRDIICFDKATDAYLTIKLPSLRESCLFQSISAIYHKSAKYAAPS